MSAAISIPFSSQTYESSRMTDHLFKLPQTEAAIVRANTVVIEVVNLSPKYAREAMIGLGGWRELVNRGITD